MRSPVTHPDWSEARKNATLGLAHPLPSAGVGLAGRPAALPYYSVVEEIVPGRGTSWWSGGTPNCA